MTSTAPTFHYDIAITAPHKHLFDITFSATGPLADSVDVCMPVWSPGSYLIREYARNVQDVSAVSPSGKKLDVRKVTKNTWRLSGTAEGFRFQFRAYANELTVQSSHLDETHGFIHPPSVCPYVDGYLASPCEVTVHAPESWRIATGLEPVAGTANRFAACDFDELADCPIECGDFQEETFTVKRRLHRIVISGSGEFDRRTLVRDAKKIVETVHAFWGGELPYTHYTFICHIYPAARGGLEHRNSTVLGIDSFSFHPRKKYEDDVLTLITHEYFHTWNVKRIRPKTLGPFDYSQENYTRLLWVFEGITSYYDGLLTRRAGLIAPKAYLKKIAEGISRLQAQPGRLHQSLAESSFDTWIKLYRPNEHSPNCSISYYLKGELVGMLLDLHLRDRTDGRVSLDDVLREMWNRYKVDGQGIEEDEFERVASEVSGLDLRKFFQKAVYSAEELDFNAAMKPFGLRIATRPKGESGDAPDGAVPMIGVDTETRDGLLAVKHVHEDSAADHAGLCAGDLLLAFDGIRVTPASYKPRLRLFKAGRTVEVTAFRRDRLVRAELTIPKRVEMEWSVEAVPNASDRQLGLRDAWLGGPLETDKTK